MAANEDVADLLFLDTFMHDNSEDLNLDLVQFSKAVVVHEVIVIPSGCKVIADIPGGVLMGATIPSSFKLEFFVNNLDKSNSTFERIGLLDYHESEEILLKSESKVPTDGLIIKGWYQTITLAVYGTVTPMIQDNSPPPPPPTSQRSKLQSVLPVGSNKSHEKFEVSQKPLMVPSLDSKSLTNLYEGFNPKDIPLEHRGPARDPRDKDGINDIPEASKSSDKSDVPHGLVKSTKDESEDHKHFSRKRQTSEKLEASPEKKRKESSPNPFFDEDVIEPGEIADAGDNVEENVDIYGTLSDGEIPDGEAELSHVSNEDNHVQFANCIPQEVSDLGEWESSEEGPWSFTALGSFNPYQCDLAPLETFPDPSLTTFEVEKQKLMEQVDAQGVVLPVTTSQLLKLVEQFKDSERLEKWVEAMETIPNILGGLPYLVVNNSKELLETLIEWTFEALDLDAISCQKQTNYRLRLMKAGMRLAGYLCTCDTDLLNKMLEKDVQNKLLNLFVSDHMSTPLKLLILQSLDNSLRFKEGFHYFLGNHIKTNQENGQSHDNVGKTCTHTPYQRVLELLQKKHASQTLEGLKALIRKCHFYEILEKLSSFTESLIKKVPPPEVKNDMMETNTGEADEMIAEVDVGYEVECIVQCLDEVYRILSEADAQINQPVRAFTKTMKFDLKPATSSLPCIYHLFNSCHFLEEVFVLLTSPATCNNSDVFVSIRNIFNFLMSCHSGLLFLSFRVDTINGILRSLTQSTDFSSEEERELSPANQLGLTLIYYLQTMQHIDQLNEYHSRGLTLNSGEANETAVLAVLLNLNSIMFTPQGREALVNVFSLDGNISSLINFIELTGEEKSKSQQSVCFAYALTILLVIARCSDKVEWLQKFGHQILGIVEDEIKNGKADDKVRELQDWLSPIKHLPSISYDSSTVTALVTFLRQYVEDVNEIPKPMITVLRILKHLSVSDNKEEESLDQLKIQWVLAELFGANCLPLFTNILQKVKDMLMLSWQQGFPQSASERSLTLSLVVPVLHLVKCLLSVLIQARGSDFKDLSAVPSLLGLHTVLCSVSPTGVLPQDLQFVQNMIVDTLMAYTQPMPPLENSEEAISKSLWSKMVKEILKYTLIAPYTFLSGLVLLSEMLPLPLPMQSKENLQKSEIHLSIVHRKKWSAHLQPHSMEIKEIIRNLAGTSCQPLIQLLRRTCWQLADLSPLMSQFIVRALLDTLVESLDHSIDPNLKSADTQPQEATSTIASGSNVVIICSEIVEEEKSNSSRPDEIPASGRTARVLNLLSFLTNQAVLKAAFLSIMRNESQSDKKYEGVIHRTCKLLNIVSDEPSHVKCQETIVSIFQSLCDPEISLITQENCSSPIEQLSNGLPSKDFVTLICKGLLSHIGNRDQKFSSILPALRTLTLLMDHDYGFYFVKEAMRQNPNALFNLFMQINATFSKDSSDCIATLSSAAECIQFLVLISAAYPSNPDKIPLSPSADDSFASSPAHRTYRMTFKEVKDVLGWSGMEDVRAHPLHDLDALLCEYTKDEETLKDVYECVHAILGILKSEEDQKVEKEVKELELLNPEKLRDQFERRIVYNTVEEEDDRLTAAYWLSTPMGDESDQEQDCERSDLIELASQYCPGFDLEGELKKGSISSETSLLPRLKSKLLTKKQGDTINTSKMKGAGNFVAPLRGRGFIRGGSSGLGRGDVFRSRPPNTSRPPSMHVDDFVKLETQNHQQPTPDVISVSIAAARRPEDVMRGGHTFDRGGARFLTNRWQIIPTPFSQRDDSALVRGSYRGLTMMTGRGIMRGTATGSPTKAAPWIFRRANYGAFGRGEGPMQDPIDRLDRRSAGYSYIHNASTLQWQDHKERETDQRFVGMPIESFSVWRDRPHHQRTSNR